MDPFITAQELTDYLGRDVTSDNGGTIAIKAACEVCRTHAEQSFTAGTSTVVLDGSGTDALVLPELPVGTVGTVVVDGGTVTDYVLRDDGTLFRRSTDSPFTVLCWPIGRQNVEITYEHGYDSVPDDIRMVALSLATRLVVQGPALQESNGNASINYGINASDLTSGEKAVLRKYRR